MYTKITIKKKKICVKYIIMVKITENKLRLKQKIRVLKTIKICQIKGYYVLFIN